MLSDGLKHTGEVFNLALLWDMQRDTSSLWHEITSTYHNTFNGTSIRQAETKGLQCQATDEVCFSIP